MQGSLEVVLQTAQRIADEARVLLNTPDIWNKIHIRDFAFSKSYLDNRHRLPSIGIKEESNEPDYEPEEDYVVPAHGRAAETSLADAPAYTGNEALHMQTIIDYENRQFMRIDKAEKAQSEIFS